MNMPDFADLVHRHWPAYEVRESHGWLLRYADGVTKRANSVFPAGAADDLDAAITAAEAFYRARGAPVVFSVDEAAPAGLDAELAARGYTVIDPTLIMTRPLDGAWDPPVHTVSLAGAPSPGWLERWWQADTAPRRGMDGMVEGAAAERILRGVPSTYAAIGGGVPDAVGRLTVTGGWAGIYCMAVRPGARRRGLGRALLAGLLDAARAEGAERAYLTVVAANAGARALYAGAGFVEAGGYHYRRNDY